VLYQIEKDAKNLSNEERKIIRDKESVPRLKELHQRLKSTQYTVLPKSPIGDAIAYTLSNWEKLYRYTEQGFIAIDNNLAENSLRPIALGRKNWMFIGSEDSGDVFSILGSLAASCKKLSVEPFSYFTDAIKRITADNYTNLEELLPDRWLNIYRQA